VTHIVRIEGAGPDRKARRLYLAEAETPIMTSAAVVKALELAETDDVDPDELRDALEATEAECAKERALRLLTYRERSAAELLNRLRDDGYSQATSQTVTERMIELGLVDDARFARMWARSRALSGMGRQRITRELASKGVSPELVADALSEALEDEELDRALGSLRSRPVPTDRKGRDRLIRRLVTRGYSIGVAAAAVAAHCEREDTDEPFVTD